MNSRLVKTLSKENSNTKVTQQLSNSAGKSIKSKVSNQPQKKNATTLLQAQITLFKMFTWEKNKQIFTYFTSLCFLRLYEFL